MQSEGFRLKDHESQLESFVRAGITHVTIISQRDGKVCNACLDLDKQGDISIEEATIDEVLPHNECTNDVCRCTYLPKNMNDNIDLNFNLKEFKMSNQETKATEQEQTENKIARNLKALGVIIIIAGIIGGLIFLGQTSNTGFNSISDTEKTTFRIMAFASFAGGITSGSLFIGISEIIKQLFQINNNQG